MTVTVLRPRIAIGLGVDAPLNFGTQTWTRTGARPLRAVRDLYSYLSVVLIYIPLALRCAFIFRHISRFGLRVFNIFFCGLTNFLVILAKSCLSYRFSSCWCWRRLIHMLRYRYVLGNVSKHRGVGCMVDGRRLVGRLVAWSLGRVSFWLGMAHRCSIPSAFMAVGSGGKVLFSFLGYWPMSSVCGKFNIAVKNTYTTIK